MCTCTCTCAYAHVHVHAYTCARAHAHRYGGSYALPDELLAEGAAARAKYGGVGGEHLACRVATLGESYMYMYMHMCMCMGTAASTWAAASPR